MTKERGLLFDHTPKKSCGCRWQVWFEGGEIHVGKACLACQKEIVELLLATWPGLPVEEKD
ncbi:MAG TPA: hypothetical protein VGH29_00950 [Candidatus Binataceae bacterium]|jgi:hypothetical protein